MSASPDPRFVIPRERLPEGFADAVDRVPDVPTTPRPAATAVLLRDGAEGPEVLLLRRHRGSGFVPGAWVFPGGRVDAGDADPGALEGAGELPDEPSLAFRVAAVREVFEETGVLLARRADGACVPDAGADPALERWRNRLMDGEASLAELLQAEGLWLEPAALVHAAHWITPVVEPRRYDTHFFLAKLPQGCAARADAREMTDLVWLSAAAALERFASGGLPMVFPTVRMLEELAGHDTVAAALEAFRGRRVRPVLPRLVRTAEGVGIALDDGIDERSAERGG